MGLHTSIREIDLYDLYLRELTLISARLYRRGDVERAVYLVTTGALDVGPLVSEVVPLQDAPRVLAGGGAAAGAMKTLVACQVSPAPTGTSAEQPSSSASIRSVGDGAR